VVPGAPSGRDPLTQQCNVTSQKTRTLSYTAVNISELACLTLLQQKATTMCELIFIVRGGKNYSEFHEWGTVHYNKVGRNFVNGRRGLKDDRKC